MRSAFFFGDDFMTVSFKNEVGIIFTASDFSSVTAGRNQEKNYNQNFHKHTVLMDPATSAG